MYGFSIPISDGEFSQLKTAVDDREYKCFCFGRKVYFPLAGVFSMLKRFADVVVDPSTVLLVSRGHESHCAGTGAASLTSSTMAVRTEDNNQMVIPISYEAATKLLDHFEQAEKT